MQTVEELEAEARKIANKIGAIKAAEVRKTNALLIGKTFKRQDSYSCPEKKSDYWWQYAKVMRMDSSGMLFALTFAIDSRGESYVQPDHCIYHAQYYTPIRPSEFERARAKFLKRMNAEVQR